MLLYLKRHLFIVLHAICVNNLNLIFECLIASNVGQAFASLRAYKVHC